MHGPGGARFSNTTEIFSITTGLLSYSSSEAVYQWRFAKKAALNSQESICSKVFLNETTGWRHGFSLKTPAQAFSKDFTKILNTSFLSTTILKQIFENRYHNSM